MLKGLTYLAIGDSITLVDAEGRNYPWLVYDYIKANYTHLKYINKGQQAITSKTVNNSKKHYLSFDADIATIALGTNDSSSGFDISVAQYEANIKSIIDYLRARNPDIKIMLCTPVGTATSDRLPYISNYRNKLIEIAAAKNTFLCRFDLALSDIMINDYDYNNDGLHPVASGHVLLANALTPIIDRAIAEI
jgi:lysophospholipase L1-like esterase